MAASSSCDWSTVVILSGRGVEQMTTTMERSLSPSLLRVFEKLDEKGNNIRKSAMEELKSYIKDLDSMDIPLFIVRVSETKDDGSSSGEFTVLLYEVLADVHGPKVVTEIDKIMSHIITTLTYSNDSYFLPRACSKVIEAIACNCIGPSMTEIEKRQIMYSLCKPLLDSLSDDTETLAFGSACCLAPLVDSNNWCFVSEYLVDDICKSCAVSISKSSDPTFHLAVVIHLSYYNLLIVKRYASLLVQSGLNILKVTAVVGDCSIRLSAVQMINLLLKSLDPKSFRSMKDLIEKVMEDCQSDERPLVTKVAWNALETARGIAMEMRDIDGDELINGQGDDLKGFDGPKISNAEFALVQSVQENASLSSRIVQSSGKLQKTLEEEKVVPAVAKDAERISSAEFVLVQSAQKNASLSSRIVQSPDKMQKKLEEKKVVPDEDTDAEKVCMQTCEGKNSIPEVYTEVEEKISKNLDYHLSSESIYKFPKGHSKSGSAMENIIQTNGGVHLPPTSRTASRFEMCGVAIFLFAIFMYLLWIGSDQEEMHQYNLVPT